MKLLLCLLVLFFTTVPVFSYAQSENNSIEDIQNTLESFLLQNERNNQESLQILSDIHNESSDLNQKLVTIQSSNKELTTSIDTTLKEIKTTIINNQQRTEETQLTNTLVQVSGIFVAIMGGFFTTKMLSMSTEKNRVQRKITEIDSEIDSNHDVVLQYQTIVDNLGMRWAREDIREFQDTLLNQYFTRKFSKDDLINEYVKSKFPTDDEEYIPDEYELEALDEQLDKINSKIQSQIKKREEFSKNPPITKLGKLFSGINPSVFSPSNLTALTMPRNYDRYNIAKEKLTIEKAKENNLKSQKDLLEDEKSDLSVPTSLKRGIIFTFIAAIFGIIMPSIYQFFGFPIPSIIGLVGFLISLVLMFSYFAYEFTKEQSTTNQT